MICPGCKREIQDNSLKCPSCGLILNGGEYRRQMEEYNRQMEEYNRQMAEYNRQMEIYRQNMNMQENNMNHAYHNRQAVSYQDNMQHTQDSGRDKKEKTAMMVMFSTAGVLIVMAVILLIVFGGKKNPVGSGNSGGANGTTEFVSSEDASTASTEIVEEPSTNEYNADNADYTVMIYMIGSNLESGDFYDNFGYYLNDGGNATYDLDQIVQADIGDNVNVILEAGGTDYWANDYGMEANRVQRFEVSDHKYMEKENLGNICMCHEEVLEDFMIWGKENYPANKYIMIYWDHGCGLTTASFGYDTNADEEDVLQIYDMAEAMKNSGIHFDMTIFNACLMGSLETASAISPYSDYMIASEEVIYTFGYYYTDWLTELSANPDITSYELGTKIIDDFETQYDYYNNHYNDHFDDSNVSSYYTYELALIDTSETVKTVEALGRMFENADKALYDYKLTEFLTARNNCGDFSGTYSADIIEFCTNYGVDGYKDVISQVESSILYKKSNIPYANGLSFYCPDGSKDGCYSYSYDGRLNLIGMNYNESCIKFYDDVLSAYAGYACSDAISQLGMDSYYNEQLVSAYDDTYTKYASGSDYNMDYTYENGKYILDLGDNFEYVDFLEQRVGYDYSENTAVVLGSDFNVVSWNDKGKVDVTFPNQWLCVDGQIVCYVVTDHVTNDDGSVVITGVVPFMFTDDDTRLYGMIINWDSNDGVTVKGYTEIDMKTLTFAESYTYSMYEGMKIKFCYGMVEHEGNQLKEETTQFTSLGDVHEYDGYGFSIDYEDIDEFRHLLGEYEDTAKGYSYMKVYDIFGDEYTTDLVPEE